MKSTRAILLFLSVVLIAGLAGSAQATTLEVTDWRVEGNSLFVTVHNPESVPQSGVIQAVIKVDNEIYHFGFLITLPAEETIEVEIIFTSPPMVISPPVITDDCLDCITEGPDPIEVRIRVVP
jgi:hypothetical protein